MGLAPELIATPEERKRVDLAILPYVSGPGWPELRADVAPLNTHRPNDFLILAQERIRERVWKAKGAAHCDPEYAGEAAWLPPIHKIRRV